MGLPSSPIQRQQRWDYHHPPSRGNKGETTIIHHPEATKVGLPSSTIQRQQRWDYHHPPSRGSKGGTTIIHHPEATKVRLPSSTIQRQQRWDYHHPPSRGSKGETTIIHHQATKMGLPSSTIQRQQRWDYHHPPSRGSTTKLTRSYHHEPLGSHPSLAQVVGSQHSAFSTAGPYPPPTFLLHEPRPKPPQHQACNYVVQMAIKMHHGKQLNLFVSFEHGAHVQGVVFN